MNHKQRRGVLVTISQEGGQVLLQLDDVKGDPSEPKIWKQDVLFTHKPFSLEQLDNLDMEEKELADFGHAILARLRAFMKGSEL